MNNVHYILVYVPPKQCTLYLFRFKDVYAYFSYIIGKHSKFMHKHIYMYRFFLSFKQAETETHTHISKTYKSVYVYKRYNLWICMHTDTLYVYSSPRWIWQKKIFDKNKGKCPPYYIDNKSFYKNSVYYVLLCFSRMRNFCSESNLWIFEKWR